MADKLKLWQLHDAIAALENDIIAAGGEYTDEQDARLTGLQIEVKTKLLSVGSWVRKLDAEIDGITAYRAEVDQRLKTLKNLKDRIKQWLWKACYDNGYIAGNSKDGFTGKPVESESIRIGWRKSQETTITSDKEEDEDMLMKSHPEFFDYDIRVNDKEAGFAILSLLEDNLITIRHRDIRKEVAKEYLEKGGAPLIGCELRHKINLQIKG